MHSLSRALRALLSLSLLAAALPESSAAAALGRTAAFARSGSARPSPALGPSRLTLSPARASALGFRASLAGSVRPAALASGSVALSAARVSPVAGIRPAGILASAAIARAAALPAASARPTQSAVASARAAVAVLAAASPEKEPRPSRPLDQLFEGSSGRPGNESAPAPVSAADASPAPASGLKPAAASREPGSAGPSLPEPPSAPRTSWKRTLSVGLLGGLAAIAISSVIPITAMALGHELHANYDVPEKVLGSNPGIAQFAFLAFAATVVAPVAEELVFRVGLQGTLARLSRRLRLGSLWIPGLITSVLFAAVHETADPVAFGARVAGSMVFAYVFHKEGLLASMSMHAFINGSVTIPMLVSATATAALGGVGALLATLFFLGFWSGAFYFGVGASRYLRGQREAMRSGAAAVKPFEPRHGLIALMVMLLGLLVVGALDWVVPILGLSIWLSARAIKARRA